METFIAGAWRSVGRGETLIGGQWRRLVRAEAYIGGAWRTIATFVLPMSVSAHDVNGLASDWKPTQVTSDPATATPSGGLAPYSYVWSVLTGDVVITAPTNAVTAFRSPVGPGVTEAATARVTCTDALGSVATADISISLTNEGI